MVIKTIGVIGGGVVGHATARAFMEWAEVRVYDPVRERRTHDMDATVECDLVFVCIPEGKVDEFFSWACGVGPNQNYVLRSTVPVGTTARLAERYGLKNLTHSPEFLTARCAVTDAQLPSRNVIGVPPGTLTDCYQTLRYLYEHRFPGAPVHSVHSNESELIKLGQNAFFAVKVAFFNELNALCGRAGADWDAVRAGILADGRIAHSHTRVPGPDGRYGFGGACLPKDLRQFIDCCSSHGLAAPVAVGAQSRNDREDRDRNGGLE